MPFLLISAFKHAYMPFYRYTKGLSTEHLETLFDVFFVQIWTRNKKDRRISSVFFDISLWCIAYLFAT